MKYYSPQKNEYPKEFIIKVNTIEYKVYIGNQSTYMWGVITPHLEDDSSYPLIFAALKKKDKKRILNNIYTKIISPAFRLSYCESIILRDMISKDEVPNDILLLYLFSC